MAASELRRASWSITRDESQTSPPRESRKMVRNGSM